MVGGHVMALVGDEEDFWGEDRYGVLLVGLSGAQKLFTGRLVDEH